MPTTALLGLPLALYGLLRPTIQKYRKYSLYDLAAKVVKIYIISKSDVQKLHGEIPRTIIFDLFYVKTSPKQLNEHLCDEVSFPEVE